jgi:hypothetical protein
VTGTVAGSMATLGIQYDYGVVQTFTGALADANHLSWAALATSRERYHSRANVDRRDRAVRSVASSRVVPWIASALLRLTDEI